MKVTGQLREPDLEPCPNRDDLQTLVDDTCGPAQCTSRGGIDPGVDCCQFWAGPDTWQQTKIRVDQIDPEKFKYEQYRYQLYAKPTDFDCRHGVAGLERVADREYVPPVTDIRSLRQATVVPLMPGGTASGVPVVPSNPGGVSEVTFPMTKATLGQPDVTSACCVPVVPCQPGYQNLTSGVRSDFRCHTAPQPGRPMQQLGPQRPDACADYACGAQPQQQAPPPGGSSCQQPGCQTACGPAPGQYAQPPANQRGVSCTGLPPAFPQNQQAYAAPQVQQLQLPKPEFKSEMNYGQSQCLDSSSQYITSGIEDGLNPQGGVDSSCTNVSTFRYPDRVMREFNNMKETALERRSRLTRMSGAYGASLQPKQKGKRAVQGPSDNIKLQGNGFLWGGYPKHENRLCYVLERNPRC